MKANANMYKAAEMAVRAKIQAYSAFDSALVSDDLLNQIVTAGVDAALSAAPATPTASVPHPAPGAPHK